MTHSVPSVSVRHTSNGSSATANEFGMRPTLERIYIGRRFKNDTERLEKLFELYTKMTAAAAPKPAASVAKGGKT